MLEALIIDDSRADRGILSLLLSEMEEISNARMFQSGKDVLSFFDSLSDTQKESKFFVLCDSQLGSDLGENVLLQISHLVKFKDRYHVLMSGVIWDKDSWKAREEIDEVMEKKGDLDIWRSDLREAVDAAMRKLL